MRERYIADPEEETMMATAPRKPSKQNTAAPARSRRPKSSPAADAGTPTPEQRHQFIAVAAYYAAERRGFLTGDATADWLAAEAEIDRLLAAGGVNP